MLRKTKDQRTEPHLWKPGARPLAWRCRAAGCWLLLVASAQVFGQVSLVDPSFKVGLGADNVVDALVLQTDQRILVGGEFTSVCGQSNSYLARLNADGSLDRSFNPPGQTDGAVSSLLRQPDGKLLVGGSFGRLLGHAQPALVRLLENGSVDASFDAGAVFTTNVSMIALALQADGRLLVGYTSADSFQAHVLRLNTNGAPDSTFLCTNQMSGYVFALLPLPDGSVLFGGNYLNLSGSPNYALFHVQPDGRLDNGFDAGLNMSSIFCLLRQTNGQILVGGLLNRIGGPSGAPLLRLNANLLWDDSFQADVFSGSTAPPYQAVYSLLLQPDNKLVVGGYFFEAGGYWRRNIVRLTSAGGVDGCFDPGLGLWEGTQPGPVRALALQADGRVLLGGCFYSVDTVYDQRNLARFLPQNDCNQIRVYLRRGDQAFAAATFPPGGTNYLETSSDLKNWQAVQTNTSPFLSLWGVVTNDAAQPVFFRAKQQPGH
jgi:uncharacterized delta-60 repeat protein